MGKYEQKTVLEDILVKCFLRKTGAKIRKVLFVFGVRKILTANPVKSEFQTYDPFISSSYFKEDC